MILPDVNVLVYAFRPEMPQHSRCLRWLQSVVDGNARFGISTLSLAAVTRVTTNRRTFTPPSLIEDAFRFGDYLLGLPHCQIVEPRERHWDIFKRLCIETDTRGPTVTDAWYAALAIEWDCEWITLDRDYARFPGLRWRVPTTAP
jgi:toxin-antitoxin system PIN domain toxin